MSILKKRTHVGKVPISWYEKRAAGSDESDGVDVIGWYRVATGVLKGQHSRVFCGTFVTEKQAEELYGEMNWYSKWTSPDPSVSHLPGEGDFVPGGEYPDDI